MDSTEVLAALTAYQDITPYSVEGAEIFLFDAPLSNSDAALRADMRIELTRLHKQIGAKSPGAVRRRTCITSRKTHSSRGSSAICG